MTALPGDAERETKACGCKVGRLIERYGLTDLNDELRRRWTGTGTERRSLRELERNVNIRVLDSAIAASESPMTGENVEAMYRFLTDDGISSGRRIEVERRLARAGVNVETTLNDFVSHQTIHSHLRGCLGASCGGELSDSERLEKAGKTVFSMQNRTKIIASETIQRLTDADTVSLPDFEVFVEIQVTCEECGRYMTAATLLEQQGCRCQGKAERASGGLAERPPESTETVD
ncbi:rod-determining factor RdfA [Halegenticoccus tardaugens]|uniref:rod-determining factor RdfA n=1 Tax=Halegenticoccus tardaugens TaxID=2071624 RepID=UPI00100A32E1|nr:rod-determining factor RdfA [Halegenticoccus tardaugens]